MNSRKNNNDDGRYDAVGCVLLTVLVIVAALAIASAIELFKLIF